MAGVAKYSISSLNSNLTNILTVGVVIAKQQPKCLTNKKHPNGHSSTERAVMNLTIRDSLHDCIGVCRWGTSEIVFQESESIHIGDTVEIMNARVTIDGEESKKYKPHTSSPFSLVVSDDGSINHYSGPTQGFQNLLKVPNRPAHNYTILSQVENTEGKEFLPSIQHFLVAVIKVGQMQSMTTKDNRQIEKQTVRLLDFTANAVPMEIWDPEYLSRTKNWIPRETVLYIADARVKWDEYKQCKIIGLSSSTVITENPDVPEATAVRNYARTVPIDFNEMVENMSNSTTDLNAIKTQFSVQKMKEKIQEKESFYALVNAYLTKLNIDGPGDPILLKCWHCHKLKRADEDMCSSSSCEQRQPVFAASFNILVSITDRTGTLENVRLGGKSAERVLGIDAEEFLEKDEEEIAELKWSLLLEKWDMKIGVQESSHHKQLVVTLLSCEPADPNEASARGISMT